MIDEKRKKEAQSNFARYLQDGLLKKESNELSKSKYLENTDLSRKTTPEAIPITASYGALRLGDKINNP